MYPARDGRSCSSEPTRVDTAQRETRAKKRSMKNLPCSTRSNAAESRSARNSSHCRAKRLQTWEIGRTLDALLAAVVEGEVENTPEALRSHLNFAVENAEEQIFQKKLRKFLTKR